MNTLSKLFLVTIVAFTFCSFNSCAQDDSLNNEIEKLTDADSARFVDIFKDIHANPELSFMEVRTAGMVAKELQSLGYTVITGILKNGEGLKI